MFYCSLSWDTRGCRMVNTTTNSTTCECNHLTNFAILMSPWVEVWTHLSQYVYTLWLYCLEDVLYCIAVCAVLNTDINFHRKLRYCVCVSYVYSNWRIILFARYLVRTTDTDTDLLIRGTKVFFYKQSEMIPIELIVCMFVFNLILSL